ncbi:hypothetical protein [Providencia phage PSTCR6]|nr:hypothetical protein [Providencia phage PSTCR6]
MYVIIYTGIIGGEVINNLFKDKNGNLNKNWKTIYLQNKELVDSIDLPYDTKTNIVLTIKGLRSLPCCKMCGKELDLTKINNTYCGKKCSAKDPDVINKKVSNTNHAEKTKKISLALKGLSTERSWHTRKKKYGPTGFSKDGLSSIRKNLDQEKTKSTLLSRYNVSNSFQIDRVKKSNRERQLLNNSSRLHLPDWLYNKEEFEKVYLASGKSGILESGCGENLFNILSYEYGLRKKAESSAEVEIKSFIKSLGFTPLKTRKIIPPYELDIYIPEKKLAIEYNGLYWHSSGSKEGDIIKNNHLLKTEMCEAKGIQLLHIFENEWTDPIKKEIWKSIIRNKLGLSKKIYARKCTVGELSNMQVKEFCVENHLQGHVNFSEAFGLFYNGELVQIASFGKGRYQDKEELLRLCSKKNIVVVGGASKLLKGKEFISYANRRWSCGNVYNKIGMVKLGVTPPCDYYLDNGKLFHRSSYMKHKLKDKLKIYDDSLTAIENCYNNNIRRIWDCGNILYEKRNP